APPAPRSRHAEAPSLGPARALERRGATRRVAGSRAREPGRARAGGPCRALARDRSRGAERHRPHLARSARPSLGALHSGARLGLGRRQLAGSRARLAARGRRRLSPDVQERAWRQARVTDRGTAEWGTVSEPWRVSGSWKRSSP